MAHDEAPPSGGKDAAAVGSIRHQSDGVLFREHLAADDHHATLSTDHAMITSNCRLVASRHVECPEGHPG